MAEHSIYAPSSLSRLLACPASFKESQKLPKAPSSSYAMHGSMLHEMFTKVWPDYTHNNSANVQAVFEKNQIKPEDQQYVLSCCDYVKVILVSSGPNATIELEKRKSLAPWGLPDVWGTADVIIDDPDNERMVICDHKFGHGVPVYAEDNEQLLTYALGAAGFPLTYNQYEVHIIQPPLDNYSSFTADRDYMTNFANKIDIGLKRANATDPEFVPSNKACRFCPAKNICRARYSLAVEEAQQVFALANKMPDVSNEEKAELARLLTSLEQVKKALYADIQATIMEGGEVPGWKLVAGRSIRKWGDDGSAMKWLMANKKIAEEDMFEQKFISPSKAEKFNRKLKKDDAFKQLIVKPMGKPQLVAAGDKRPDYDINATADAVFSKT